MKFFIGCIITLILLTVCSSTATAQSVLTNGWTFIKTITSGESNTWTFTANSGDNLVVRMGRLTNGTVNYFCPYLRLYGPDGSLLVSSPSTGYAAEVAARATNSGTFTVIVANNDNYYNGANGTYGITLGKTGSSIVVAPGEQGGPLTNGYTTFGTMGSGQLEVWSFSANSGDNLVARMGRLTNGTVTVFCPYLRLYGPDGTLLVSSPSTGYAAEVAARATNSGTFTVIVANNDNYYNGANGTYGITLGKTGSSIVVAPGEQGGPLTNGYTTFGTMGSGQLEVWSFSANSGDNLVARMGRLTNGTVNYFCPYLRLYGPDGSLLVSSPSTGYAAEVAARATNSGTFTVIVANNDNYYNGANGTYGITLGKTGSSIVVAPGEQGGPLTNGYTTFGTMGSGQLEVWSFSANSGDNLVARMGRLTNGTVTVFCPYLRLYGPDGSLLVSSPSTGYAAEVAARATNSGTFTVIAANNDNYYNGANGTYGITLGKTGNPIVVASGGQGGSMTNGFDVYTGTLTNGELDVWQFTECAGDAIVMQMTNTASVKTLYPYLRLYGPDGSLLASMASSGPAANVSIVPTNSGTFILIAGNNDGYVNGGNGAFELIVNSLSDGFKTCSPVITGANVNVAGVGGPVGTNAVLFTTTNIANHAFWTPVRTNLFDQFGVFQYTNGFNPAEPKRFFRLSHP